MYEYIGIYDEQFIQLHSVKIKANTKEEAVNKFKNYLKNKLVSIFVEEFCYVVPLYCIDEI